MPSDWCARPSPPGWKNKPAAVSSVSRMRRSHVMHTERCARRVAGVRRTCAVGGQIRMRQVTRWGGIARRPGGPWRELTLLACALALVLAGSGLASAARPTSVAAAIPGAATATPSPAGPPAPSDAYATGQAMSHFQGQPYSWAWRASLPGSRIVLYYGVVGAPTAGVIGYYGGNED